MELREIRLEPEYLKRLEGEIDASDFIKLMEDAKRLMGQKFVELKTDKPVVFVGDLHGDVDTVFKLFEKIGLEKVLEEFVIVFLGDYVDRGPNQIATLLLPLALKAKRGEEVIVLRGNHEPPEWLPVFPNDFKEEVLPMTFGEAWREVYKSVQELFDSLTPSARVNGVVAVHGGIPFSRLKSCEGVDCVTPATREDVEDVLWSDPEEICKWSDPLELCVERNYYRGAGKIWGAGATRVFLERSGSKMIVRGHTPVNGFQFFHNNKVLTLFTRLGAPYYNSSACVAVLENEEIRTVCVG